MGTVPANGTTRLFISYSHADNAIAERLATDLRQRTFSVWMDRSNIEASQVWSSEIEQAIRGCEFFLVLLSPHSIDSSWVRREIFYAQQWQKVIVPILIAPTTIPIQISDLQYADCTHDYQRGLQTLLLALGVSASTATPLPTHAAASEPAPLASNTVVAEGSIAQRPALSPAPGNRDPEDIVADTRARANNALSTASARRRSTRPRLRASRSVLIVTCVALLVGSSLALIAHTAQLGAFHTDAGKTSAPDVPPGHVTFTAFVNGVNPPPQYKQSAPGCGSSQNQWTVNDPAPTLKVCLPDGSGTRLSLRDSPAPNNFNYLQIFYSPSSDNPSPDKYASVVVRDMSNHVCGKLDMQGNAPSQYYFGLQVCASGTFKVQVSALNQSPVEVVGHTSTQASYALQIAVTDGSAVFSINSLMVESVPLVASPAHSGFLTLDVVPES